MNRVELHNLVDDLPDDAVEGAALFLKQVLLRRIDPGQLWFWHATWQAREREVDEAIARGEPGITHSNDDDFLASLEARLQSATD